MMKLFVPTFSPTSFQWADNFSQWGLKSTGKNYLEDPEDFLLGVLNRVRGRMIPVVSGDSFRYLALYNMTLRYEALFNRFFLVF